MHKKAICINVYRKAIRSLHYLATNSKPDICVAISIQAKRVENPKQDDLTGVKRVFRYLKKTKDKKLNLSQNHNTSGLVCYVNADWRNNAADRKSNTGYCFQYMNSTVY